MEARDFQRIRMDMVSGFAASVGLDLASKVIRLPAGVTKLDRTLRPPSGSSIRGEGRASILRLAPGLNADAIIVQQVSDVSLSDFVLECNGATQSAGNGIDIDQSTGIDISRVQIRNPKGSPIIIARGCSDVSVENCSLEGGESHGISLSESEDVRVSINRIHNAGKSGVNVSGSRDVTVLGNVIRRETVDTVGFGGIRFSNGSTRGTAIGNTVSKHGRGIFVTTGSAHLTLEANILWDLAFQGIFIEYVDGHPPREMHVSANGNQIRNPGLAAPVEAIRIVDARRFTLLGNIASADGPTMTYGILATGPVGDYSFDSKTLFDYTIAPTLGMVA
jgi:hypothetical protein